MNSNSKYQENNDKQSDFQKKVVCRLNDLRLKRAIAVYKKEEKSYLIRSTYSDKSNHFSLRKEIQELILEIDCLDGQIKAYESNDNKAKIIPDRLL